MAVQELSADRRSVRRFVRLERGCDRALATFNGGALQGAGVCDGELHADWQVCGLGVGEARIGRGPVSGWWTA
jgi:hypothetical protein